jgi:hypothetical protein
VIDYIFSFASCSKYYDIPFSFLEERINMKYQNKPRCLRSVVIALLLIVPVVSLYAMQRNHRKSQNPEKKETIYRVLFDGKTLDGWMIPNFGTQGSVKVSDSSIVLGMGDGCTGLTWKGEFLKINYEVSLKAMRIDGNDFFCGMTFPVLDEFCTLIIGGWGGSIVGLSCIDGYDASDNSTSTMKTFGNNRWYLIRLRVTKKSIKAWINDRIVVDFERQGERLSLRPEVLLSRPFGITSWKTTAALRNIAVKEID